MDLSALESVSRDLERSLDFWGFLLLVSTAVVVLGLIVEYWHDVKEVWVIVHWPMAAFPWDKFKTLIGGILVTIGVAGELIVTYEASRVETQVRENSHKIEVLLTQQAGDAAHSAKIAHEEADAVKGIADEARADAKDALVKAKAAQGELANAEADAAKAQTTASNALRSMEGVVRQAAEVSKKVEAAKNDIAVLQSLMSARRTIDADAFKQLKTPTLKGKMIFTNSTNEVEPKTLCLEIISALRLVAEMNPAGGCGSMEFVGPGIFVAGPDPAESKLVAKALSEAIGVNVVPVPDPSNRQYGNPNVLKVFIGIKGLFWFGK